MTSSPSTTFYTNLQLHAAEHPSVMASVDTPIEALNTVASNTVTVIAQLEAVLADVVANKESREPPKALQPASEKPVEALSLAHDSATLIRAHATKISLLIINEPFTSTAITKVLRELVAGPLPGLASASQLCDPTRYTETIRRDLSLRSSQVLKHIKELVQLIPRMGRSCPKSRRIRIRERPGEQGKHPDHGSIVDGV